MGRRNANGALLLLALAAAAAQAAHAASFYEILKSDPSHKLIARAVDSDPEGKLKTLLQQTVPITAFVPTDGAFIKAAMKLRSQKGVDAGSVMKNHCLIAAILKQHMIPGLYDTAKLREIADKPSMLVTKKMVPNTKGKVTVSWPLKFTQGAGGELTVSSAAKMPDPSNPKRMIPATTGTLVAPMDVHAGNGIIHNINGLLLPMADLARLVKVAGCSTS